MSFSFQPMTEEELQSLKLVEEDIYDFEVVKSTQKVSKSGNQMIELQLMIWDKQGKAYTIFDYLVNTTSMLYKIKHFCDCVGLQNEYKSGNFDVTQCDNKKGLCNIIIQSGKKNPMGGFYPDKNAVKDYIVNTNIISDNKNHEIEKLEFSDSEIPF